MVPLFPASDTVESREALFSERQEERNNLVQKIKKQGIDSQRVLDAMREVPRHHFIPKNYRGQAYANSPQPIGFSQTISQPFIVAYMTQLLNVAPGDKILEVGTGSGYQAAVLAELTEEVYTIEIIEELGKRAQEIFDKLGYSSIHTQIGDGYKGWPTYAPFDGIIITAAADEIPDPLLNQLKTGGVLIMPYSVTSNLQSLIRVTKTADGEITKEEILPVRFVPMTGEVQQN
ncbi:MAG: protein-L-isoaspartate(D-aspartate) O-methyltransferase [Balneolaceae bacterium]|nr:protein-L-isoaspartate(D-aspartate) O-methyltransferase [Balneolaceae bacterium]